MGTHFDTFFEGAKTIVFGVQMTGAKTIGFGAQRRKMTPWPGPAPASESVFSPHETTIQNLWLGFFGSLWLMPPGLASGVSFLTVLGAPGIIDFGRDFDAHFGVTF